MLSTYYRGYDIQACCHGGFQIYLNEKSCQVRGLDSIKQAKALIDSWIDQEEHEGYCDSIASQRDY